MVMEIQEPSAKLMRWRLHLAEYTFTVMYKLGALNTQADALSRLHTKGETVHEDWDDIPTLSINECESYDPTRKAEGELDNDNTIDVSDINADELFVANHQPQRNDPIITPITHE